MRSALICVFFTLVVQKGGNCIASTENEEEFKPTPIPLSDWPREKQKTAETLQEIIKTEGSSTAAEVPPHYWENALRHSVYLTLVRDKIDQLIAQGDYISPDSKPENEIGKEIDDHDLWDKIKTASFDRLKEEPIPPAEIIILAKGRLIQDEEEYRFIEEPLQSNCSDSDCMKGAKAFWSVKRMRHGDAPGKYHYELTFSVTSQTTRKVKKPYENPVRTFTIKETAPPAERPQARPHGKTIYRNNDRPQRALWVHRNINPIPSYQKRPPPHSHGLDRIFSSLFSDEENYAEPYRFRPKTYYNNMYSQQSQGGHADNRDPYHQKKQVPYPKAKPPQPYRSTHPPNGVSAPYVQNPYINADQSLLNQYNQQQIGSYSDNRYLPSNVVKTTRPAVLPTPITNYPLLKESTIDVPVKTLFNATEYTTKEPDVMTTYKIYKHQKPSPMKINFMSDHIRPPVYNAPPGVFVTMDKKPFKPMPPLKYSNLNRPQKPSLPNFRPSPQVLDTQFSEQDMSGDTAFRPITMNYTDAGNISKKNNKNIRKPSTLKKPVKKHENIKSSHLSIETPEIITAESVTVQDSDDFEMEWANILGAFTKTTPMASSKDRGTKENIDSITSTTPLSTTIYEDSYEELEDTRDEQITSTSTTTTTTTTTTPKPKKRTRPPPKFNKPDKIKKHKRVTSTTTTTTTTTPTPTPKPSRTYPTKKPTDDLTPQASSAATSSTNSIRDTKTQNASPITTTSSTTPRPTNTTDLTTSTSGTTSTSRPTVDTEQPVVTTQPKSKNRFRQSTLMHKGTSVNHDKWSTSTLDKNRTNTITSYNYQLRRKASKFQGYIPSSTPRSPEVERDREDHRDHAYHFNKQTISSTTAKVEDIQVKIPQPTQPTYEDEELTDERSSDLANADELEQKQEKNVNISEHRETLIDVQESKDDNEYIFPTASIIHEVNEYMDLEEQTATTELTVVASPYSVKNNKTKCKKKKLNNLTTTEGAFALSSESNTERTNVSSTTSTTESPVTPDIFNELFGGFTMDDEDLETTSADRSAPPPEEPKASESEVHESYSDIDDDDLEDFLHSIDQKSNNDDEADEEYDDKMDEKADDSDSPFNFHENEEPTKSDYYDDSSEDQDEPYNLLKLMGME